MDKKELKKLIKKHVDARIALSWKGTKSPEEAEEIERRMKSTAKNLNSYINGMHLEHED